MSDGFVRRGHGWGWVRRMHARTAKRHGSLGSRAYFLFFSLI